MKPWPFGWRGLLGLEHGAVFGLLLGLVLGLILGLPLGLPLGPGSALGCGGVGRELPAGVDEGGAAPAGAVGPPDRAAGPAGGEAGARADAAAPGGPTEADLKVSTDPLVIASQLTRVERRIRDGSVDDGVAGQWGHVQQRIYRALAADEVLANAVERSMPDPLKDVFAKTLFGTKQIARTVTRPRTDLPDWRIVEARPMAELRGYYEQAGAAHSVPWTVLAAINLNETRMGRLRGTSPAGARGPMQFMPATWEGYGLGGDVESDRDAIVGAANYVSKSGWSSDRRKAIWAYNHSEAYIDAILAFAELMETDPLAYRGYWGWQVYYRTVQGAIWLEPGYASAERIPIEAYCSTKTPVHCPPIHPEAGPRP